MHTTLVLKAHKTHRIRLKVVHISTLSNIRTAQSITIRIITPIDPNISTRNTHLYISSLFRELPLHLERLLNEQRAGALECVGGVGPFVCLDLDRNVVFQRMGDFVTCKEDCGV